MPAKAFSDIRGRLDATMDEVCESRAPLIITRRGKPAVVMLSLEEWEGLEETLAILSNPERAERLRRSIASINAGRIVEHDPT
jgi:antitoxin YefM